MAQLAYRKSTRWIGLGVALFLAGFAGFFGVLFLIQRTGLERVLGYWLSLFAAFVPMLAAVVAIALLLKRLNRTRVAGAAAQLGDLGFRVSKSPDEIERVAFSSPIVHLMPSLGLTTAATGIQWLATEEGADKKALLFEHRYTTGSGKTTVEYCHTVIAWPSGHPELRDGGLPAAPWLFMGKYPASRRRSRRKQELVVPELTDVAQSWSMTGDAATALRFLTPTVRRALDTSPTFEAWCMGAGWVCCSFEGTLDAENMKRFLSHCRGVVAAGA